MDMKKKLGVLLIFLAIASTLAAQTLLTATETSDVPVPESPDADYTIVAYFDGIPGEYNGEGHKDWMEISTFTFSMSKPTMGASGSSRRRRTVVFDDVQLTKYVDKATPKLMEAAALGTVISEVTFEFRRVIGEELVVFHKYEFDNALITSYQFSGSTGDAPPEDSFTMNFEVVKVTYTEYDESGMPAGNVEFEFSVEEGE